MADEISLIEELRKKRQSPEQRAAEERPTHAWQQRTEEKPPAGELADEEGETQTKAFGYYRGVRERAGFIEFQRRKGSWPAPGYAWLPCPLWHPSGTGKGRGQAIVLEFLTGLIVTIRGRNLRPIFEGILRQRVFRVTEMGEDMERFLPDDDTVVYAIEITETEALTA